MKYFKALCLITALAIVIAVVASIFGIQAYNTYTAAITDAGLNNVTVATVVKDVPAYTTITPDMVQLTDMPQKAVPDNAVTDLSKLVNYKLTLALKKGSVVSDSMVLGNTDTGVLSSSVGKDKTAITVRVTDESGLANMIHQGDYLDIMASSDTGSQIIATGLKVIALGSSTVSYTDTATYSTITLEVTKDQATMLDAAEKKSSLRFIMSDAKQQGNNISSNVLNTNVTNAANTDSSSSQQKTAVSSNTSSVAITK